MKKNKTPLLVASITMLLGLALIVGSVVVACNNKPPQMKANDLKKDYQIDLHMDTVWLYDGERLVGKFINEKWDSQLDSLIMKDNL